jgi:hypothetical protein
MKGVVELLVLEAIESELGDNLEIQEFFDLIMGTRYAVLFSINGLLTLFSLL